MGSRLTSFMSGSPPSCLSVYDALGFPFDIVLGSPNKRLDRSVHKNKGKVGSLWCPEEDSNLHVHKDTST